MLKFVIRNSGIIRTTFTHVLGTSSSRIRGRAECGGADVYQPILDPVEHPKPVVEPTLFDAVPFEIFKHAGNYCGGLQLHGLLE